MAGSIWIPRVANQEDPKNQPPSFSHGNRNSSRKAEVYQLQAPPPGSYQDDDTGPSPKNLVMAVQGVKSAVDVFAKALIVDMKKFPEEFEHLKQTISREVKAEVDRVDHWEFLVQAFVCQRLFEGFDEPNGFFGIECYRTWQMTSTMSFMDFSTFKDTAATILGLLTKDTPDESFLGEFCFKKFKSIIGDSATNLPLPIFQVDWMTVARKLHPLSNFYQSFLKAAVSVWTLHRLVHSFEQGWKMFGWETYPKRSQFQRKYMQSIVPGYCKEEDEDSDVNFEVGFLVIPGFQVSESVVKCEVFIRIKDRHMDGKIIVAIPEKASSDKSPWSLQTPGKTSRNKSPASLQSHDSFNSASNNRGHPSEASIVKESDFWNSRSPLYSSTISEVSSKKFSSSGSHRPHGRMDHSVSDLPELHRSATHADEAFNPSPRAEIAPSASCSQTIEDVVKKYTWNQVLGLTNDLTSRQLGKGGFGTVYLGKLENEKEVAVKILDASSQQGISEFFNEVNLLKRVNHVNLVKLLGYCQDEKQVLIYEFAEEGSIWDHLQGGGKCLDWKQRLSIALQSACGLEYLHIGCSPRIVHRDIKSQNILLTKSMVAKVADFGVSKLGSDQDHISKAHVTTMVRGTVGYLDPEYLHTGQLREKSDVYSFGVVLLEIITGRKPIQNSDRICFIGDWVEDHYSSGSSSSSRGLKTVADPTLGGHYNPKALKLVINVAKSCIQPRGASRPEMSEVVRVLKNAQMIELDEKKSSNWLPFR